MLSLKCIVNLSDGILIVEVSCVTRLDGVVRTYLCSHLKQVENKTNVQNCTVHTLDDTTWVPGRRDTNQASPVTAESWRTQSLADALMCDTSELGRPKTLGRGGRVTDGCGLQTAARFL